MQCLECNGQNKEEASFCVSCGASLTGKAPESASLEKRKEVLSRQIQTAVAKGGRIESQSDTVAIVVTGKKVNHLLHFIIGIFTLGFWWIVWIILAISGGEKRQMITVDEFGRPLVQRA